MNSQSVIALLTEKITHLRIAVIGDVMLDRYAYGEVRRISPEAPVPVTRVKRLTSLGRCRQCGGKLGRPGGPGLCGGHDG